MEKRLTRSGECAIILSTMNICLNNHGEQGGIEVPATSERSLAEILSDLASVGPFVPGSVRKGGVQRHRNKAGELVEYRTQPMLNIRVGGRRVDKRFPDRLYERMSELAANYRRFKALVAEFEAAALRENFPCGAKKNSRRQPPSSRALPTSRPRSRR